MKPEILIRNRRTGVEVVAMLGDGPPKVTGYTGWVSVPRPRRVPMSDWSEGESLRQSIPILLDGLIANQSVQQSFDRLEAMARKKGNKRPPTVKVTGPVFHTDLIWVVEDIDWGDLVRNADGVLIRQHGTLMLMGHEAGDIVKSPAKRKQERKGGRAGGRTYTVKRGDTLSQIAARKLGSASRWKEIARLNGIRDPRRVKVGRKLRLPAKGD